ncbi:MAG TPA: ferritin-like domain-containing protein [Oligoflexus sp.]|uniref:ferritin-like domain-containing protein n=1 Tax=Oligoflexus sp. TaxID=1971216 RepID=UPI002D59D2F4|nr:ferritin-like domain-containing protein [Oligoflexus sp.]HYX34830.1 ferritin-like domain-containing protein [Oligoflexus sp.]
MKNPTDLGFNRTGISTSPLLTKEMLSDMIPPSSQGDSGSLLSYREIFLREAEPIGTVPIPTEIKGMASAAIHALKGERMQVLIDKLSERASFERTGVRLYDLLINKCTERNAAADGISLDQIRAIRDDELHHFRLVAQTMRKLGADPTAMSPSADVHAVMSMGPLKVIADPRTSVQHSFQAILVAELTDNAEWPLLIKLADSMGMKEEVTAFEAAQATELRHLADIRAIVHRLTLNDAQLLH